MGFMVRYGCFGLTALVCAVGGYVAFYLTIGKAAGSLPSELAAARAVGLPLTADELRKQIGNPPPDNAAPLYQDAIDYAAAIGANHDIEIVKKGQWGIDASKRAAMWPALGRLHRLVAMIEVATDKPSCQFDRRWELGADLPSPELASMHGFAWLLSATALNQERDGDLTGAFKTLGRLHSLTRHLQIDRLSGTVFAGCHYEILAQETAFAILANHAGDPKCVSLAQAFFNSTFVPDQRQVIATELVLIRYAIQRCRHSDELFGAVSDVADASPAPPNILKRAAEAGAIRIAVDIVRSLPADPEDYLKTYSSEQKIMDRMFDDHSVSGRAVQGVAGGLFSFGPLDQIVARKRIGLLTVQLLQEPDMKPADAIGRLGRDAIDPYTNKPLQVRIDPAGLKVYSLGRNGRDDNGFSSRDFAVHPNADDITLTIRSPNRATSRARPSVHPRRAN